jgi:tetratricopeptide (TPR) repeat protein
MAAALIPIFFRSLLQRLKSPLSGEKMLLIEAAMLVAVVTPLAYDSSQTGKELCDCDQWINQYTRPGDNVLIVSSAVAPAYPSLLLLDRKNGSRYLWSAPLVMLEYARTEQEKIQKAAKARQKSVAAAPAQTQTQAEDQIELIENQERQILERLEQDIHERKPKLVMVEYCQFVGRQNLFEVLARRGIIQNDLGAYQNLGICNRFVGFVYTGDTRSSFESTFADLGAPQSPPSSAPGCPGLAHMERFRLALATIARADRKILLKSAGAEPIDYCRRGQAYLDISMYQSAAADFQRALNTAAVGADKAAGPIQEDAYIELGYCMLHIQHYQEARDKFLQALALAPSTRAQAGLGVASLALGQDKAAQACAAAALSDQAGGSPPTKPVPNKQSTALAHALLAAIKRREGDLGAAAAEADLAMGMDPDCARGYLEKAWILGAQKKFDQMLRMADESIDRNYANTEAHLCRAQALKNLSQPGFECEKTVAASLAGKE